MYHFSLFCNLNTIFDDNVTMLMTMLVEWCVYCVYFHSLCCSWTFSSSAGESVPGFVHVDCRVTTIVSLYSAVNVIVMTTGGVTWGQVKGLAPWGGI